MTFSQNFIIDKENYVAIKDFTLIKNRKNVVLCKFYQQNNKKLKKRNNNQSRFNNLMW